jgi:hypothetical protein
MAHCKEEAARGTEGLGAPAAAVVQRFERLLRSPRGSTSEAGMLPTRTASRRLVAACAAELADGGADAACPAGNPGSLGGLMLFGGTGEFLLKQSRPPDTEIRRKSRRSK